MENLNGKMEEFIEENGLMENNMELEYFNRMLKTKRDRENGKMEKDLDGLRKVTRHHSNSLEVVNDLKVIHCVTQFV